MWQFALAPLLHSIAEKDATRGLRKVNTSTGGEREGEERGRGDTKGAAIATRSRAVCK